MERALVLIGVHHTGGFERLPAVGAALDAMRSWAQQQGFPPEAICELNDLDDTPVRAGAVFDAVAAYSARETLRQLIIYFCGHGMVAEGELWLLSGAPTNPNEAVNVPLSVRNAERGAVPHVVFISDACRTATNTIQTGSVPGSVIFPHRAAVGSTQMVDLLYAAGAGAAGHQVAEVGIEQVFHPVFTEVLAEGLAGGASVTVDRITEAGNTFDMVRPRPLLRAVKTEVGNRLVDLGHMSVIQVPDGRIASDELAWLSRLTPIPRDDRRNDPPGLDDPRLLPPPTPVDPRQSAAEAAAARLLEVVERAEPDGSSGLVVAGAEMHTAASALGNPVDQRAGRVRVTLGRSQRDVVVIEVGGTTAAVPVYPGRLGVVTFEDAELVDITYVASDPEGRPTPEDTQYRAWVGAASRFGLAWWGDDNASQVVDRARRMTATDPSYAMHAAYALVELGRRDLVPELLDVAIPPLYDVALLAEDLGEPVAGTFPLLSRGWTLMGPAGVAPRPDLPARLPSAYSLFGPEAADVLRQQISTPTATAREVKMRSLIFVHGRAQERKEPAALKAEWIAALKEGLDKAGLSLDLPDHTVRFPYYGDTLEHLSEAWAGKSPEVIVMGVAEGASEQERVFIEEMVRDLAESEGITQAQIDAEEQTLVVEAGIQNWKAVLAALRILQRVKPLGTAALFLATRDVYHYLGNPGIQTRIETGVTAALEGHGECVVVAHSLGSVVAYNVIARAGASRSWSVPAYITVGSPLAVDPVKERLRPLVRPAEMTTWFNAYDPDDVVALHPLDATHFPVDPAVENFGGVHNETSNQHGISGYLSDPTVARRIYEALLG